jgi:hypothetical protein
MEGTIFGIIAVFFGLLSIGYSAYSYLRAAQSRSWPRAEGMVTQVSVKHAQSTQNPGAPNSSEEWYLPEIQYTYTVRGRSYTGNRIRIGEITAMPHEAVLQLVRPYRDGMKVRVYYDPSTPAFSVLETRTDNMTTIRYAAIGIALLAAVVYARFFWGR